VLAFSSFWAKFRVYNNVHSLKQQTNYTGSFHNPEVVLSPLQFQGEFTKNQILITNAQAHKQETSNTQAHKQEISYAQAQKQETYKQTNYKE